MTETNSSNQDLGPLEPLLKNLEYIYYIQEQNLGENDHPGIMKTLESIATNMPENPPSVLACKIGILTTLKLLQSAQSQASDWKSHTQRLGPFD